MRRYHILTGISGALLTCLLAGCHADGYDEAGDLYGRWKLTNVSAPTPIVYTDTLYLAFQGYVYQYQPNWDYDWGVYHHRNDSLILGAMQYDKFHFLEMGIAGRKMNEGVDFKIDELTKKKLQISRHDTIWMFKKYLD